jgi:hypothetical protein
MKTTTRSIILGPVVAWLLLCCLQPASAQNQGKRKWTVWHESCPVYATIDRKVDIDQASSPPLEQLAKGTVIEGVRYFKAANEVEWIAFKHEGEARYALFAYLTHIPASNAIKGNLPFGKEKVDRWNGLPQNYKPTDLTAIDSRYCWNTFEHLLRREAKQALIEMLDAAREEKKLSIKVVSSYRSASWQQRKFLDQLTKLGLGQRTSAKPGHSEHQLGTTVDVTGGDPRHLLQASFGETPESKWLKENSARFGFRITYTKKTQKQTGYQPEPWHLRYIGKK